MKDLKPELEIAPQNSLKKKKKKMKSFRLKTRRAREPNKKGRRSMVLAILLLHAL
jgi:hypothetical protein